MGTEENNTQPCFVVPSRDLDVCVFVCVCACVGESSCPPLL